MLELNHVSKHFGSVKAVVDLSLTVPAGELFCFLGPNGAGKTTTIKMIAGLMRPASGTVRVGGFDVQRDPVGAKRLLGYIPDTPFLYERLTPVEFMYFTGDLYDIPRDRVDAEIVSSFRMFGLKECQGSLIRDLSHGMRQRLIYCATFLHKPHLLLIDEPLIGIDPYTIRMIKELLARKAAEGAAIFLTTHILALAEDIAHRIGIILDGSLIAVGTMKELRALAGVAGPLEDVFLALTRGREDGPVATTREKT